MILFNIIYCFETNQCKTCPRKIIFHDYTYQDLLKVQCKTPEKIHFRLKTNIYQSPFSAFTFRLKSPNICKLRNQGLRHCCGFGRIVSGSGLEKSDPDPDPT